MLMVIWATAPGESLGLESDRVLLLSSSTSWWSGMVTGCMGVTGAMRQEKEVLKGIS